MLVHLDGRVLVLDGVEVRPRANSGRRGDDADAASSRGQRGRDGAGPHHSENRQVVAAPEVGQGDGGGGVAGYDQRLDVAQDEGVEGLHTEAPNLVVRADTVRGSRVVAQVDGRFERQPAQDLAQNGQPADT